MKYILKDIIIYWVLCIFWFVFYPIRCATAREYSINVYFNDAKNEFAKSNLN